MKDSLLYVCCRLFGPLVIKGTVKKRTHGKGYGVLFNCLVARAMYTDVAEGYDMGSFFMVVRRFVSNKWYPIKMIYDAGTQLIALWRELQKIVHTCTWNWEDIMKFWKLKAWIGRQQNQRENGCTETFIRSTKLSLETAIGSAIMTFSELQTVLLEVSIGSAACLFLLMLLMLYIIQYVSNQLRVL